MVRETVPNEIAITKIVMRVIEMIAVAVTDPRAIRVHLITALRCMVLLVMPQPTADRHSVVRSIVVRHIVAQGDMAHHDMNRALAAPIIAAQALAIAVDARTMALRVTTIPLDAPQIAVAKCTAAHKIIAGQNNMPRAITAAPVRAPVRVPASSAAADPLLPPGVSVALVGAASAPADLARLAMEAEVSVLQHLAAVDLAEASDLVDLGAASAARP